jgi:hypothetical protein
MVLPIKVCAMSHLASPVLGSALLRRVLIGRPQASSDAGAVAARAATVRRSLVHFLNQLDAVQ